MAIFNIRLVVLDVLFMHFIHKHPAFLVSLSIDGSFCLCYNGYNGFQDRLFGIRREVHQKK